MQMLNDTLSDRNALIVWHALNQYGKHNNYKRTQLLEKLSVEDPPLYKILFYPKDDLEFILLCLDMHESLGRKRRMVLNSIRSQVCKVLGVKVEGHVEWESDVEEPCWLSVAC